MDLLILNRLRTFGWCFQHQMDRCRPSNHNRCVRTALMTLFTISQAMSCSCQAKPAVPRVARSGEPLSSKDAGGGQHLL